MSVPVGLTIPKLLPVTGTFAPLFATYYFILNGRVSIARKEDNKAIGPAEKELAPLNIAVRSHSNFAENVPFALLLGAVVEMNGGNRRLLSGGFAALIVARILHVEFGLRGPNAMGLGRLIGHVVTQGIIVGFAGWGAYLVKGYWGF